MTTSATQPGVPTEKTGETTEEQTTQQATEQPLSPRELMMKQIDEGNTARLNDELVKSGQAPIVPDAPTPTPAPTPAPAPAPAPATDQVDAQLADDIVIDEAELARYKVRTKVEGKEEVIPVADMRRTYQKGAAADRRLDEASRLLREAKEQAEALKTQPPVRSDAPAPAPQSTDQPAEDVETTRKELVDALFKGDEEKALSALDKVINAGRQAPTPAVDANQLAAQLTPAIKQQLVVESALEKFSKDNPDIVSDPYLDQMTAGFIEQELKEGKTFVEALEPAAKKTRDWLASKGVVAQTTAAPTMDRTTKLERKEGIDVIPSLNTKATTTEEPELSASEVIAQMRKARGMEV